MPDITTLADLTPDRHNARRRGPRAERLIVNSLHEVGAARSIVIDETGRVLAGNGTVNAAAEAGIERVQVVDADGETIIAVRRSGLTEEQKVRLALLDNRAGDIDQSYDPTILAAMAEQGIDLNDLWDPAEMEAMIVAEGEPVAPGDGGDEFDATPDEGPTRCQPGDLWLLGPHRLVCGDCTDAEVVARVMGGKKAALMVTDPPYGVEYDAAWRNAAMPAKNDPERWTDQHGRAIGKVANDTRSDWAAAWCLFDGDVAYVWHAPGSNQATVLASLQSAGFEARNHIIWAKNQLVIGRGHYHHKHEPCWYAVRVGASAQWTGDRKQTTLWAIDKPVKSDTGHSTQKPVECMERPMRNHGHAGDLIYDPFLGSGTTLIAAQRLGRVCYGCEIEPRYCDVILRRYEAETGDVPTKAL